MVFTSNLEATSNLVTSMASVTRFVTRSEVLLCGVKKMGERLLALPILSDPERSSQPAFQHDCMSVAGALLSPPLARGYSSLSIGVTPTDPGDTFASPIQLGPRGCHAHSTRVGLI